MTAAIEAALRRHRALSLAALIALTLLAWLWLLAGAGMGMDPLASLSLYPAHETAMPDMAMRTMIPPWSAGRIALTFAMWWIMMVAMMLPSAAPTILLYVRAAVHGDPATPPATASFLVGYLTVWALFSLLATLLQMMLGQNGLLAPMLMASKSRWLSAAILFSAGIYQLSPAKNVCLRHCRSPAQFLSRHFRPGQAGAWRMGAIHGSYCVGCCWLLMALLFVGGVMNLVWIALLTLMVALEKYLPFGRSVAIATGLGCIAWGAALVLG